MCSISTQNNLIGRANTLEQAREIAKKNDGNEVITREKDGNYTVTKLDDSEVNKVEQKPAAEFGASVIEFALKQTTGSDKIITNKNASFVNKAISKYQGSQFDKVVEKTGEEINNVVQKANKGINNAIDTFGGLVHDGLEFLTPAINFTKNIFFQGTVAKPINMRSSASNCGACSGATVAELFVPGVSKGKNDFALTIRDQAGKRVGALTEGEIIKGVKSATQGKVDGKIIDNDYRPNDKKESERLMNDIKSEIQKGNLLVLCTGFSTRENGPRHYVTIVGIDKSGNLLVSDSYKDKGGTAPDVWTPEKLQERMNRTDTSRNKNSSLVSFSKVK